MWKMTPEKKAEWRQRKHMEDLIRTMWHKWGGWFDLGLLERFEYDPSHLRLARKYARLHPDQVGFIIYPRGLTDYWFYWIANSKAQSCKGVDCMNMVLGIRRKMKPHGTWSYESAESPWKEQIMANDTIRPLMERFYQIEGEGI